MRCSAAGRNCIPGIGNPQFEETVIGFGADPDRLVRRPVRQGVTEKVGEQLSQPRTVAIDWIGQIELHFDGAIRMAGVKLRDNLFQNRYYRSIAIVSDRQPAAEPAPRKIQYVVDQSGHSKDGALHQVEDVGRLII